MNRNLFLAAVILIAPHCKAAEKAKTPEPQKNPVAASALQKAVSFTQMNEPGETKKEEKTQVPISNTSHKQVVLKKKDSPLSARRAEQRKLKGYNQQQIPRTL